MGDETREENNVAQAYIHWVVISSLLPPPVHATILHGDCGNGCVLHHESEEVIRVPMYEYKCLDCGKESLLSLTLSAHESAVTCPSCQGQRMEQLISSVTAKTSRKS
jgi:putative FmdB family regulatory protein